MNRQDNCMCCGLPKAHLITKRSVLLTEWDFKTCQTCLDKNFEPRYVIIMAARSLGFQTVKKQIKDHLYHGEDIIGSDLLV